MRRLIGVFLTVATLITLSCGCASSGREAGKEDLIPGMEDVDDIGIQTNHILTIAQKMARSLMEVPALMPKENQPVPVIKLGQVTNYSAMPIPDKDAFLVRLRVELKKHCKDKLEFIIPPKNKSVTPDIKANYVLEGEVRGITKQQKSGESINNYIFYTFQLIDPATRKSVWEDLYEFEVRGRKKTIDE